MALGNYVQGKCQLSRQKDFGKPAATLHQWEDALGTYVRTYKTACAEVSCWSRRIPMDTYVLHSLQFTISGYKNVYKSGFLPSGNNSLMDRPVQK